MNICILGHYTDYQSGWYIFHTIKEMRGRGIGMLGFIETREPVTSQGPVEGQEIIKREIDDLSFKPDMVLVLKGMEIHPDTLDYAREAWDDPIMVNWFFDKYLADKPIWDTDPYLPVLKSFDYYFVSLEGVKDKLEEKGFDNVYYLDEACFPPLNGPQHMNHFQRDKYGSDVAFIGSIGLFRHHPKRVPLLEFIADSGFDLKIWGPVVAEWKKFPQVIRECHAKKSVINEDHSKVVQASEIVLGIDQDTDLKNGFSARLWRTLCAGGLYLSTPTKGLEETFEINGPGEPITGDQDIVVFYDEDHLIESLDFLLEHDSIRESIRQNGKKKAENNTFEHRIETMLKIIEENTND